MGNDSSLKHTNHANHNHTKNIIQFFDEFNMKYSNILMSNHNITFTRIKKYALHYHKPYLKYIRNHSIVINKTTHSIATFEEQNLFYYQNRHVLDTIQIKGSIQRHF
eukprot:207122_1